MNSSTNCARGTRFGRPSQHRPVVALGDRRLDDHPQLAVVRSASHWRAISRVSSRPEHRHRARVGGERLPQQHRHRRPRSPAIRSRGARARTASIAAHERVAGEQRERGIDRQQPAPEEARLQAQVEEQRDGEDRAAARAVRGRAARAAPRPRRPRRRRPAEPPDQAVEVVERPGVLLLAELVLVAGQLGLAAQLVQRGLEVDEEVRVRDEEGEQRAAARARARRGRRPAARHASRAASSGSSSASAGREQHEPGGVLEADRQPCRDARRSAPLQPARLVHADREQQRRGRPAPAFRRRSPRCARTRPAGTRSRGSRRRRARCGGSTAGGRRSRRRATPARHSTAASPRESSKIHRRCCDSRSRIFSPPPNGSDATR